MYVPVSFMRLFKRTGNVAARGALENCKENIGGMIQDISVAVVLLIISACIILSSNSFTTYS